MAIDNGHKPNIKMTRDVIERRFLVLISLNIIGMKLVYHFAL